jgi:predicted permease
MQGTLRTILSRVLGLFRGARAARELKAELEAHFDLLVSENIARGLSPADARMAARRTLGAVEPMREAYRDQAAFAWANSFQQDVRYAFRRLRRAPVFAAVGILSLAIGIGANSAVFSLLDAAVLRPLPVPHPDHLVTIATTYKAGDQSASLSYPEFELIRSRCPAFSDVAVFWSASVLYGRGVHSRRVLDYEVSGNYFDVVGVHPFLGRGFSGSEGWVAGSAPVVVVSYGFWKAQLAADAHAIGRAIAINGRDYTIIGVAPKGFVGTERIQAVDFWLPVTMHVALNPGSRLEDWTGNEFNQSFWNIARLKPGITVAQADAALSVLQSQLAHERPQVYRDRRLSTAPPGLFAPSLRRQVLSFGIILLAVLGLVLLLACLNIANLLLARGVERRRELAIRLAVGSSRRRLARQLLTESFVISGIGGAAGWALALALLRIIAGVSLTGDVPFISIDYEMDWRVFAFTAVLAIASAFVFGAIPAWQATRSDPATVLKSAASAGGHQRSLLGEILTLSEVTLAVLAVVVAGLMIRSLLWIQQRGPGFDSRNVVVATFDLREQGYSDEQTRQFYGELQAGALALPGVASASLTSYLPLSSSYGVGGEVSRPGGSRPTECRLVAITPQYFRTIRVPLLAGREFDDRDQPNSTPVVIVNRSLARALYPNSSAVGRSLLYSKKPSQIVGVAADYDSDSLAEGPNPYVFWPESQHSWSHMNLLVRGSDPAQLPGEVRELVARMDHRLAISNITRLDATVNAALLPARAGAILLGSFGLLALLLAVIGIYGVLSFQVSRRVAEIGTRMALGARREDVLRLILLQGMRVAIIGIALGMAASFSVAGAVSGMLYGIRARDPLTFSATAVLLASAAFVATWIPARRAVAIDPARALRSE